MNTWAQETNKALRSRGLEGMVRINKEEMERGGDKKVMAVVTSPRSIRSLS